MSEDFIRKNEIGVTRTDLNAHRSFHCAYPLYHHVYIRLASLTCYHDSTGNLSFDLALGPLPSVCAISQLSGALLWFQLWTFPSIILPLFPFGQVIFEGPFCPVPCPIVQKKFLVFSYALGYIHLSVLIGNHPGL